jgi:hypothetical protein
MPDTKTFTSQCRLLAYFPPDVLTVPLTLTLTHIQRLLSYCTIRRHSGQQYRQGSKPPVAVLLCRRAITQLFWTFRILRHQPLTERHTMPGNILHSSGISVCPLIWRHIEGLSSYSRATPWHVSFLDCLCLQFHPSKCCHLIMPLCTTRSMVKILSQPAPHVNTMSLLQIPF